MLPVQETDHQGTARALLTDQFRGRFAVQGILDSFSAEIQVLENVIFDVINLRLLDAATFAQLDSLGDLVGEARQGRSDTEYREAIRLRIKVNRSQGRAEDVIQVADIASDGVAMYQEVYPAGCMVTALDIAAPRVLQNLIRQTRAVATRAVLITSDWDTSEDFVFGSTTGAVAGERGFGSSTDSYISRMTSGVDA